MIRGGRLRPLAVARDKPLEIEGVGSIPPITQWFPELQGRRRTISASSCPRASPAEVLATLDQVWKDTIANSEALKNYATERGARLRARSGERGAEARHAGDPAAAAWLMLRTAARPRSRRDSSASRGPEPRTGAGPTSVARRSSLLGVWCLGLRHGQQSWPWTGSRARAPTPGRPPGLVPGMLGAVLTLLGGACCCARPPRSRGRRQGRDGGGERRAQARWRPWRRWPLCLVLYSLGLLGRHAVLARDGPLRRRLRASSPGRGGAPRPPLAARRAGAAVSPRGRRPSTSSSRTSSWSGCPEAQCRDFGSSSARRSGASSSPDDAGARPWARRWSAIVIGALPGLTATHGRGADDHAHARLDAEQALLILSAPMSAPSTAAAAAPSCSTSRARRPAPRSCLDGYALARQGWPARPWASPPPARCSAPGSACCSWRCCTPVLGEVALKFGSYEFFWLARLRRGHLRQLSPAATRSRAGSPASSACCSPWSGRRASTPMSASPSASRDLAGGFGLIPALVGAFGFAEVLSAMQASGSEPVTINASTRSSRSIARRAALLAHHHPLGRDRHLHRHRARRRRGRRRLDLLRRGQARQQGEGKIRQGLGRGPDGGRDRRQCLRARGGHPGADARRAGLGAGGRAARRHADPRRAARAD